MVSTRELLGAELPRTLGEHRARDAKTPLNLEELARRFDEALDSIDQNFRSLLGRRFNAGTGVIDLDGVITRETARGITPVNRAGTLRPVPRRVSATDSPYYVPANMHQSIMNAYDALRDDHSDVAVAAHSMFGVIEIPAGIHQLEDELAFEDVCNIALVGPEGSMGDEGLTTLGGYNHRGGGMCQLLAPATAGKYCIRIESTGGHNFSGPTLMNMVLVGNSDCEGGVLIRKYSNMRMKNVKTIDFENGAGVWIDGDGTASQYGTFEKLRDSGSLYGLRLSEGSGHVFTGLMYSGDRNNSDGILANSKGIWCDAQGLNGSHIFLGARVQGYDCLLDIEDDDGSTFLGFRGEGWNNSGIGIRLRNTLGGGGRCHYTTFFGGILNNNLSGNGGTGIKLEAGVDRIVVIMPHIEAVSTPLDNSSGSDRHVFFLDSVDPYVGKLRCDNFGADLSGETDLDLGNIIDSYEAYDKAGNFIGYVPIVDLNP